MPSKILLQPNLTCNGILFKNILCREALKINFKQLNVFRAPNSKSKTQSQKILVSVFLGLLTGLYTNSMAYTFSDQSSDMTWFYLLTQLGVMLHITITWLTPLVIIQILLAYLNGKCNSAKVNLFEECKECLDIHNSFSKSFRLFFFVYFIYNQSYAIFFVFSALRRIIDPDIQRTVEGVIGALGVTGQIIFVLISLIIITGAIDESFESLQGLKIPIQDKLLMCPGEMERAKMKYLLQRIQDVKPMNAYGYFEIGKSTLTSMLSIRFSIKYGIPASNS